VHPDPLALRTLQRDGRILGDTRRCLALLLQLDLDRLVVRRDDLVTLVDLRQVANAIVGLEGVEMALRIAQGTELVVDNRPRTIARASLQRLRRVDPSPTTVP